LLAQQLVIADFPIYYIFQIPNTTAGILKNCALIYFTILISITADQNLNKEYLVNPAYRKRYQTARRE